MKNRSIVQIIVFFFLIGQFLWGLAPFQFNFSPQPVQASQPYATAYTTMTNSRLSFKGALAVGMSTGANTITIGNAAPDTVIDNLFPNDEICFNGSAGNGCKNSNTGTTYLVNNIPGGTGSTLFSVNTGLTGSMNVNDFVVASQSSVLTITFKPNQTVGVGDTIQIIIPAAASNSADGIPDSTGFDAAGFPTNLLTGTNPNNGADCNLGSVRRCLTATGAGFTPATATLTTGTTHTISITSSNALSASNTYTIAIGDTNPSNYAQRTLQFINPAPASGHTRGNADTYSITLQTQSGSFIPDKTIMKVAPNDGVLVSANVELSITYTIDDGGGASYLGVGASACPNHVNTVATTASTVPFGSIVSTNSFYNATQTHYVVTNASNGYVVTAQQNGVMTNNVGATIASTTCDTGTCTSSTGGTWSTPTNNGFGYSLVNLSGTSDIPTSGTVYRQFSTTATNIMSYSGPTAGTRDAVCYRLSTSTTQQTGYYFNKLTYIATPKF